MSSLEKCLFRSPGHFLRAFFIELFISFYILETKSLSVASFANVFFHSVSCPIVCCRFPMVFKTYSVD